MNAGKITAKLRDAVPVEFYSDGIEKAAYRNIDIPDSLKALEIADFRFIIQDDGKISFRLYFAPGILPASFPPAREKLTREQKRAAKANVINTADLAAAAAEAIAAAGGTNITVTPTPGQDYTIATPQGAVIAEVHYKELDDAPAAEEDEEPSEAEEAPEATEEPAIIRFDVPGKKRGALARAIGEALGCEAEYLNPPSYAYQIGTLGLERDGSLIGELPSGLLETLAEQGFTPAAAE